MDPDQSNNTLVLDTSAVLAVALAEPGKARILEATSGSLLVCAESIDFEVGNALSSLFKSKKLELGKALESLAAYRKMIFTRHPVNLEAAVHLSHKLNIYAYDAYVLEVAITFQSPIVTLDRRLANHARALSVSVVEV